MLDSNEFYTLKGYSSKMEKETLTTAMEDYLEMMYRLYLDQESIRIKRLSELLHVKPSSTSKMAAVLKEANYIFFKKYGHILLTDKGKETGQYLLYRHEVLHEFFCCINHSENELILVEKIEHFINPETVKNIKRWLDANEEGEGEEGD